MEFGTPIDIYNNSHVSIKKLMGKSVREGSYLVQDNENKKIISKILSNIDNKFERMLNNIDPEMFTGEEKKMIQILKDTPHIFLEINHNTGFLGVNYPLGVRKTNLIKFGTDGNERAIGRAVFLTVSPKYIKDKRLEDLVIHELSHTLANHVKYRPDDHGEDFVQAENLFKKIWALY
tara:strand:+ start:24 stop:554 length:531 start_codon:yes stop_codon:yes gene_type:complete